MQLHSSGVIISFILPERIPCYPQSPLQARDGQFGENQVDLIVLQISIQFSVAVKAGFRCRISVRSMYRGKKAQ